MVLVLGWLGCSSVACFLFMMFHLLRAGRHAFHALTQTNRRLGRTPHLEVSNGLDTNSGEASHPGLYFGHRSQQELSFATATAASLVVCVLLKCFRLGLV